MRKTKIKEGDIINSHTVVKFTHKINKAWYVDSICGNCSKISNRRLSSLRYLNSCKNCKTKRNNEHYSWKGCGEISSELCTIYKHSSIAKKLEFDVTVEYLWDLFIKQNRRCVFTGELLYFNKTSKNLKNRTASLDRIDSSLGYIKGNLQWVHRDVNKLKKNFSDERFLEICLKIARFKNKIVKTEEYEHD